MKMKRRKHREIAAKAAAAAKENGVKYQWLAYMAKRMASIAAINGVSGGWHHREKPDNWRKAQRSALACPQRQQAASASAAGEIMA
jgi:hypothetical protein